MNTIKVNYYDITKDRRTSTTISYVIAEHYYKIKAGEKKHRELWINNHMNNELEKAVKKEVQEFINNKDLKLLKKGEWYGKNHIEKTLMLEIIHHERSN